MQLRDNATNASDESLQSEGPFRKYRSFAHATSKEAAKSGASPREVVLSDIVPKVLHFDPLDLRDDQLFEKNYVTNVLQKPYRSAALRWLLDGCGIGVVVMLPFGPVGLIIGFVAGALLGLSFGLLSDLVKLRHKHSEAARQMAKVRHLMRWADYHFASSEDKFQLLYKVILEYHALARLGGVSATARRTLKPLYSFLRRPDVQHIIGLYLELFFANWRRMRLEEINMCRIMFEVCIGCCEHTHGKPPEIVAQMENLLRLNPFVDVLFERAGQLSREGGLDKSLRQTDWVAYADAGDISAPEIFRQDIRSAAPQIFRTGPPADLPSDFDDPSGGLRSSANKGERSPEMKPNRAQSISSSSVRYDDASSSGTSDNTAQEKHGGKRPLATLPGTNEITDIELGVPISSTDFGKHLTTTHWATDIGGTHTKRKSSKTGGLCPRKRCKPLLGSVSSGPLCGASRKSGPSGGSSISGVRLPGDCSPKQVFNELQPVAQTASPFPFNPNIYLTKLSEDAVSENWRDRTPTTRPTSENSIGPDCQAVFGLHSDALNSNVHREEKSGEMNPARSPESSPSEEYLYGQSLISVTRIPLARGPSQATTEASQSAEWNNATFSAAARPLLSNYQVQGGPKSHFDTHRSLLTSQHSVTKASPYSIETQRQNVKAEVPGQYSDTEEVGSYSSTGDKFAGKRSRFATQPQPQQQFGYPSPRETTSFRRSNESEDSRVAPHSGRTDASRNREDVASAIERLASESLKPSEVHVSLKKGSQDFNQTHLPSPLTLYLSTAEAVPTPIKKATQDLEKTVNIQGSSLSEPRADQFGEKRLFRSLSDLSRFEESLKHQTPIGLYEFEFLRELEPLTGKKTNDGAGSPGRQWENPVNKPHIKVFKLKGESSVVMVKAYATLANIPPNVVAYLIRHIPSRASWDRTFDDYRLIERNASKNEIIYCSMKAPWPIANRDFLQWRRTIIEENGDVLILMRSALHPDFPDRQGVIRAETIISGYIVRGTEGGKSTALFILAQTDVRGLLPKFAVNTAAQRAPLSWTENLRKACEKYIKKNGAVLPPYDSTKACV